MLKNKTSFNSQYINTRQLSNMDALGDLLEPYSAAIGQVAGAITTLQFLSGFFLLNDIRKKGSSDVYPVGPFLGGIVL